jgi:predicted nucleic acid-binding protein
MRPIVIALDSNIFIYVLEQNPEFGGLSRWLLKAIEESEIDACASELIYLETLSTPKLTDADAALAKKSLQQLGAELFPITLEVHVEAARLRRQYRLGTLDAIHVATAIKHGASHFITNDRKLFKKKLPGIEILPLTRVKETSLFV